MSQIKDSLNNQCQHLIKSKENIGICSTIPDCNTFIADTSPRHICPRWAKQEINSLKNQIKILTGEKQSV
jgi:hypothetical protein